MSLVTKLVHLVSNLVGVADASGEPGLSDERIAAAALLVHVARADGRIDTSERNRLVNIFMARFGWSDATARRLVERADELDREVDDVAELIDMMGHSLAPADKRQLVGMAYQVAAADGRVLEFEDDLVWRLGHLMGFDDRDIAAIRAGAIGDADVPAA